MANIDFFDYDLEKELIAQHPIYPRDHARLMVVHRDSGRIEHKKFYEIVEYINPNDCIVINNSKVLRARFLGKDSKTLGKREVFLIKYLGSNQWIALTNPNKKVKVDDLILINESPYIAVKVLRKENYGENVVEFLSPLSMEEILSYGEVPLPPYIKSKAIESEYQTIYAELLGSVASPTAGLHFTDELFDKIRDIGAEITHITLHVGLGTFKPIKVDDLNKHKMHEEEFFISEESAKIINETKRLGGKIIAVGTTTVRTLETAASREGFVKSMSGYTRLFIKPGYPFKMVDRIVTNFHFPKTTLIALISAFTGVELTQKAYKIATSERYRFYSFGDAMLIL